jgi:pyrroloquinoline quinone biosynthesis protein E
VPGPRPFNLVAELTYRCPLRCPYCSNPLDHASLRDGLDADAWARVLREAAELGVIHVGLTGGEPSARSDLEAIVRAAADAGLYTHLVTSGRPLTPERLAGLREAGLRSVQLSFQDAERDASDRIAGTESFDAKLELARAVRDLDLPLVLNVVLHRENLARTAEVIALARELDAERLELANVQLHGWARHNRKALLPTREALESAARTVRAARRQAERPEIVFVLPDHWSERPKPCMGGWGRKTIVVAPDGLVMPCHEARALPDIELWSAAEHPLRACWEDAPGMNAYRGQDWMREPCRSCPERERDFGGCRCQAFYLAGDPSISDPACALSPAREALIAARADAEANAHWVHRGDRPRA